MICPNCKNNKDLDVGYEILDCESSKSTWDDYDQILKLKCKKCNHEFVHVD